MNSVSQIQTRYRAPEWDKATAALENARSVVIVTHISPDGDAIGSALGLGNAIRAMGRQVTIACDDGVPSFLMFLPFAETVVHELESLVVAPDAGSPAANTWDLMISTDASDEARTGNCGQVARENSAVVINLDHHVTNTGFGDIHLVDGDTVSASQVAYQWLAMMQLPITEAVSTPLLTGLVTDTLGFRISSVTSTTLEIAHRLMVTSQPLFQIINRTLASITAPEFRLWQRILPNVTIEHEIACVVIDQADVKAVGFDEVTDAGLVSFLNEIDIVKAAIIFKRVSPEETRITMRAKYGYDVASVAFELGGGGHLQAAGATLLGDFAASQRSALQLIRESIARTDKAAS